MKKIILMNMKENQVSSFDSLCAKFDKYFKNRVIVETDFDEEVKGKFEIFNKSRPLRYDTDEIKIEIVYEMDLKEYEVRIWRKDRKFHKSKHFETAKEIAYEDSLLIQNIRGFQTVVVYDCYTKAREVMLDVIREYEGCEIYGYMRCPTTCRQFNIYDNDGIIKKFDLHKID